MSQILKQKLHTSTKTFQTIHLNNSKHFSNIQVIPISDKLQLTSIFNNFSIWQNHCFLQYLASCKNYLKKLAIAQYHELFL